MKKAICILAIAIVIVTIGCEKENNDRENQIEFEGEVYPLSWGATDYLEYKGLYEHTIRLLPTAMYLVTNTDSLVYLQGDGTFMGFLVLSSTQALVGSYSVPEDRVIERAGGQIRYAAMITWPSEDGYIFDKQGNLDITKSGDDYEISFIGVEEEGRTINAYYSGTLIGLN